MTRTKPVSRVLSSASSRRRWGRSTIRSSTPILVAEHGDAELGLPNGTTTVGDVLEPLQDEEQTYHDKEELETMIMNMVDEDAIGRENYSDRDSSGIGEEPDDGESDDEDKSL